MNVKVFHQVSFAGMERGYRAGDPMWLVFEFDLPTVGENTLESLFAEFNISQDGLGGEYRAKNLRSLSKGDIITFGDTDSWAVAGSGWTKLDEPLTVSTPDVDRAEIAYIVIGFEHRLALHDCTILSTESISLNPDITNEAALAIMQLWQRLTITQRTALVGFHLDERGHLSLEKPE